MARTPWVGGNWKCNGTKTSIAELCKTLNASEFDNSKIDVAIFPTSLHWSQTREQLNKKFIVGSQNVSKTDNGAYTGELSASMLSDMGCQWTLIGHSERRSLYHETDEDTAVKVNVALDKGLKVCLCIGETLKEREAGETNAVCARQIQACIGSIKNWSNVVIAYEPVWAIGTGKVATQEQAQEAHEAIRDFISRKVSEEVAANVRIVYGGSVSDSNAAGLIQMKDIDGFLVGGASLKPAFVKIIDTVVKGRC